MNVDVHGDPIASLARGTKVDLVFNPQKTLVLAS
jgi:iron(III) transport system ATP-binding protein